LQNVWQLSRNNAELLKYAERVPDMPGLPDFSVELKSHARETVAHLEGFEPVTPGFEDWW
jgi:hypothetical protein